MNIDTESSETIAAQRQKRNLVLPPAEYLRQCFDYNPESGEFFWKYRPITHFRNHHAMEVGNGWTGKRAGTVSNRDEFSRSVLLTFWYNGRHAKYPAHRIAYAMMYGDFDHDLMVDHKNRDQLDNRIENLRLANKSDNAFNSKARRFNGKERGLPKCVYRTKNGRFYSIITGPKKTQLYLGTFDTPEEASKVYFERAKVIAGEFARQ